jgi:hypothetical protein
MKHRQHYKHSGIIWSLFGVKREIPRIEPWAHILVGHPLSPRADIGADQSEGNVVSVELFATVILDGFQFELNFLGFGIGDGLQEDRI